MNFQETINAGMLAATNVMGEDFSIGGGVSSGIFDSLEMGVTRDPFGDNEEVTAAVTFPSLHCKPYVGMIIIRAGSGDKFKVLDFDSDIAGITLNVKLLGKRSHA
jgi:hypothetical protein